MHASSQPSAGHDPPPGLLRLFVLFHESQSLGAGTSVLRVVDELAAYGWSTSGWLPGRGPLLGQAHSTLARVTGAERPLAFSVRGWKEGTGPVRRVRAIPRYARLVRDALLRTRPHVVHANTLLSLPEAAIARSCGLPVVLQLHEIPPPGAKRTAALRAAGRVADVVVAVSDAVAAMARPHLGRTPVVVVRNGVPVAPARIEPGAAPFFVGTVGTVSDVKGTDVLLRAARIVVEQRPSIRFEHAGDPSLHRDAGLDETLARLRAELPEGTFELLGPRPADEVLPRWHVFAFPSRSEAFPLATLEAMAAGVPVVASAVGGIPEQIADEHGGLVVPPGDADALAAAIVRLHDDGGLRRRLAAAAAERVRREFTLAQQAEGLHRAYLAAIDLRFAPPPVRQHVRAAL